MKKAWLGFGMALALTLAGRSASAGYGCYEWTPDVTLSEVAIEDAKDGRVIARIVTNETINGVNQWAFVVTANSAPRVELLASALLNKKRIAIRWSDVGRCSTTHKYVTYTMAEDASPALNIDRAISITFRSY